MGNVISECAPTGMHIIFINQWWQSFCFHVVFMFFWQSISSILRHLVSKEFAGKHKFARRHWKNAFFHPAKCCHWQLPSHYMQIMHESITQAPSPPLLSGEGSWGELHIFQDKGFFNILFNSIKQVSDFYQSSILCPLIKKIWKWDFS